MIGPIYTEQTACQDCYRCLRQCPVKAIRVQDGHAAVVPERCLNCGLCLNECPSEAKKIRSDVGRVRQVLSLGRQVVVSLAPSWVVEFEGEEEQFLQKLHAQGFLRVESTALGASLVAKTAIKNPKLAQGISGACPTIVEYITRYRPELSPLLSPLVSPLEAHARSIKDRFGSECIVVFIGPCVAKKLEADHMASAVDLALTFREAKEWLEDSKTTKDYTLVVPPECDDFFLEGGFLRALSQAQLNHEKTSCGGDGSGDNLAMMNHPMISKGIALSGLDSILESFDDLEGLERSSLPPLEFLACPGGCHNGPGTCQEKSSLSRHIAAAKGLERGRSLVKKAKALPELPMEKLLRLYCLSPPIQNHKPEEPDVRGFLTTLGRLSPQDDPDCGSCGYSSCRSFAAAVLDGMAEESMCVSVMRRRAQNQNDALMRSIPLGVVIVDQDLAIRKCNNLFLRLFTDVDFDPPTAVLEQVRGRKIERYIDQLNPLRDVLEGTIESFSGRIESRGRYYRATVFPVSHGESVGAVFQDITSPQVKRETVIRKAEEVIQKSLSSVQQIASLLGENAAETQLILDSLIEAFGE
ncbi:MAG: 4Fe-4S dicluster domain-containing protein [Spirochaetales bacterium]|nr:4Fe-4S dicluster domain-containing protein [Spirochaetales bacterium]